MRLPDETGALICAHLCVREQCRVMSVNRTVKLWASSSLAGTHMLCARALGLTKDMAEPATFAWVLCSLRSRLVSTTAVDLRELAYCTSDTALAHLPRATRVLDLCGCRAVSNQGLVRGLRACPQLQELLLRDCDLVDDVSLRVIAKTCHALRALSVSGCTKVTDRGVSALSACRSLQKLGLNRCREVTSSSVAMLAHCKELECLDIGCIAGADDAALKQVIQNCEKLRWLNLAGNAHIGDETLELLTRHCPVLERLVCNGCDLITSKGVVAVCRSGSALQWIHVSGLETVKDTCLRAIAHCPRLESVDIRGCAHLTRASVEDFYAIRRSMFPALNASDIRFLADDSLAAYAAMAAALAPRGARAAGAPPRRRRRPLRPTALGHAVTTRPANH